MVRQRSGVSEAAASAAVAESDRRSLTSPWRRRHGDDYNDYNIED